MPLMKSSSKEAFSRNVAAEVNSGRPMKQSLAIAYSVQRRARKANGGMIHGYATDGEVEPSYIDRMSRELGLDQSPQQSPEQQELERRAWARYDSGPKRRASESDRVQDFSNMPFGTTSEQESAAALPYDPKNPDPLTVGAGLASIPLMMGGAGAMGRLIGKAGSAIAGSPRIAAATGAVGALGATIPEAGEAQYWGQQQEGPTRAQLDARARRQAAEAERQLELTRKATDDARARERQLGITGTMPTPEQFKERGYTAESGRAFWNATTPDMRATFYSMPATDKLNMLKISPQQWLGMSQPERTDAQRSIARIEAAEHEKSLPAFERWPELLAVPPAAIAVGAVIGLRNKGAQITAAKEWLGKVQEASANAQKVMTEAGRGSPQGQGALRMLAATEKEADAFRRGLWKSDAKTAAIVFGAGAEGTAVNPELTAMYNWPLAREQLTDPSSLVRAGVMGGGGMMAAMLAGKLRGPALDRALNRAKMVAPEYRAMLHQAAPRRGLFGGEKPLGYEPKQFPGEPQPPFAFGGMTPSYAHGGETERYGMMMGGTPGRADKIPLMPRGGSYVIPADIVSALGQGNSMAGGKKLSTMFGGGPYGTPATPFPKIHNRMPRSMTLAPAAGHAAGGATGGPTKIMVSDGEYVLDPEQVQKAGGAEVLDELVKLVRQQNVQHLANLPPPRGDGSAPDDPSAGIGMRGAPSLGEQFGSGVRAIGDGLKEPAGRGVDWLRGKLGFDDGGEIHDGADADSMRSQMAGASPFTAGDISAIWDNPQDLTPMDEQRLRASAPYRGDWGRQLGRR